jgi:ASCH domain-containing protein
MSLALSVRQPWAWAIIAGGKDVENRSWNSRYRGPLLIHAARTLDPDGIADLQARGLEPPAELVRGAIIGQVRLVDVVRDHSSSWAEAGAFHFVLADPVAFAQPRPWRGMPGLFRAR